MVNLQPENTGNWDHPHRIQRHIHYSVHGAWNGGSRFWTGTPGHGRQQAPELPSQGLQINGRPVLQSAFWHMKDRNKIRSDSSGKASPGRRSSDILCRGPGCPSGLHGMTWMPSQDSLNIDPLKYRQLRYFPLSTPSEAWVLPRCRPLTLGSSKSQLLARTTDSGLAPHLGQGRPRLDTDENMLQLPQKTTDRKDICFPVTVCFGLNHPVTFRAIKVSFLDKGSRLRLPLSMQSRGCVYGLDHDAPTSPGQFFLGLINHILQAFFQDFKKSHGLYGSIFIPDRHTGTDEPVQVHSGKG